MAGKLESNLGHVTYLIMKNCRISRGGQSPFIINNNYKGEFYENEESFPKNT